MDSARSEKAAVRERTQIRIARVVSVVLHPFLVAPLAIMLILYLDGIRLLGAAAWAGLCAILVVIPVVSYIAYKLARKQVTDVDVSVREDRYIFYLLGAICLMICFATLLWLEAPKSLQAVFISGMLTILFFAFVTRMWTKVSIHAGILGGMATATAFYSPLIAIILAGCTVLVAWSRLTLKRHSVVEVVSGLLIACSIAFLSMVSTV